MVSDQCGLEPCACEYAATLLPGGRNRHLANTALMRLSEPTPHEDGCPCTVCYSRRAGSWLYPLTHSFAVPNGDSSLPCVVRVAGFAETKEGNS
jgi:hypothetical protein